MHAVVTTLTIHDAEAAQRELDDKLVPWISHSPGFVAGCWTTRGDSGLTMLIFESQETAERIYEQVKSAVPDALTLETAEVRDVAAYEFRTATEPNHELES